MKTKIRIVSFLVVSLFSLFLVACDPSGQKNVDKNFNLKGSTLTNDIYTIKVSNDEDFFDFTEVVEANIKTTWQVFISEEILDDKSCFLEIGDNEYNISFTFSDNSQIDVVVNVYRRDIYTVKFNTNTTQKISSIQVEEDSLITAPETVLTKSGSAFVGWVYNFNTPVTSDITIEARWQANSYVVTYDANGGEVESESTIVKYGDEYVLDIPSLEGYDFLGWKYNDKTINSSVWNIAENITVVAEWTRTRTTFEIEYVIVGAVGPNLERTYSNKEALVLRTPYKCGYKFLGWYFESDFSDERVYEIPVGTEGDLRIYSKWEVFKLAGAEISFLGDSITTFYSASSEVNSDYNGTNQYYYPLYSSTVKSVTQTWWHQVITATKTKLVKNDSISGSSCFNNNSETTLGPAMNMNRISNLGTPDIVVVFIGTNDNVNGFTEAQFSAAYDKMIKRIKAQCPDAFIFCCTMGYSNYHNTPTHYFYKEETRLAFNPQIISAVNRNDCVLINFAEVQTIDNYSTLLGDNLHPNLTGMNAFAQKAIQVIKNHVGAV